MSKNLVNNYLSQFKIFNNINKFKILPLQNKFQTVLSHILFDQSNWLAH